MNIICKCERCNLPLYSHDDIYDLDGHEGWGEVCEDCKDTIGDPAETYFHMDGMTFPDYEDSIVTIQGILESDIGIPDKSTQFELSTKDGHKIKAYLREGYSFIDVLKVYLVNPQFSTIEVTWFKPTGETLGHMTLVCGDGIDVLKALTNDPMVEEESTFATITKSIESHGMIEGEYVLHEGIWINLLESSYTFDSNVMNAGGPLPVTLADLESDVTIIFQDGSMVKGHFPVGHREAWTPVLSHFMKVYPNVMYGDCKWSDQDYGDISGYGPISEE